MWSALPRAILAAPEHWQKWALYDRAPLAQWGKGPATLLGDAAHPMLPYLAQGAAMAIEDAAVLAQRLADARHHSAAAMRRHERPPPPPARPPPPAPPQRDGLSVGRSRGVSAYPRAHRHRRRAAARALRLALWLDAGLRLRSPSMPLFATTIAGSLPKPAWLAEPNRLWPPWRATGAGLADAKRDATLLALKLQEDCGIDIVTDGEQSRQHFVHGFVEFVDGIDFARKVEIGIRADRYKAMVPTVTGALRLKARVHAREAQLARA